MVEIAISLAVIGFALVAIIGVLPTGMNVQRDNREETIVNQDSTIFMNAIRNGAQGLDDLTNYVEYIINNVTQVRIEQGGRTNITGPYTYIYPSTVLTSGAYIIGLLSTPKIVPFSYPGNYNGYYSNHITALFRSMSGQASDKPPQNNGTMLDSAFSYKLISEVVPFCQYDTNWFYIPPNWQTVISTNDFLARSNYQAYVKDMTNNLFDLRLTFRWPLYATNGLGTNNLGNNRQVFRAPANGTFSYWVLTNLPTGFPLQASGVNTEPPNRFWFCQSSIYVQGQ